MGAKMNLILAFIIFVPCTLPVIYGNPSVWEEDCLIGNEEPNPKLDEVKSMWPEGVVPYTVGPGLESINGLVIEVAKEFFQKTCIRFVTKRPSDEHFLQFIRNDSLCGRATVCKAGEIQKIWIGKDCFNYKTVVHELGHAVCMSHEHQRPDRDQYITVKCEQYAKKNSEHSALGLLYDYASIMHYTNCNGTCLEPKSPRVQTCGGLRLSVLDAEKINTLYDCGGCHGYRFRPSNSVNQSQIFVAGKAINGSELGVCRVNLDGDILLGYILTLDTPCCIASNDGSEIFVRPFEVLTDVNSKQFGWHSVGNGESVPYHSIPGGWGTDGQPQFIGRCNTTDGNVPVTIPGRIHKGVMTYAHWGHVHSCQNFQVLRYLS